ncbi:MAG TPA: amino acid adenylation domain-containing protein, partial [Kofleriaceae bacterium]|nr:amino acid adenylation domain-containing protein [Kofleriaceae bacterium]
PRVAQGLPPHVARVVMVDAPAAAELPTWRPAPRARLDDIAYVIYTSGTTGRPKGVEIPHRAAVNLLSSVQRRPGLTEADRLLAVTSLSFDISVLEMFLTLSVGAQIHIADRATTMDGAALGRLLDQDAITVLQATPSTWRLLLDAGWQGRPGLACFVGGEAVPRELADALLARTRVVWNMYGPTETTVYSVIHPLSAGTGPVLIGRPIANTRVAILDRNLALVPAGVTGELYIGGAGLARGYLGRPELTRERFIDDPFAPGERLYRTGDLARWRPEGAIECLGRIDHQVKLRGYRIELGEIEAVLRAVPGVRDAVVILRQDPPGDPRLVAYVVPGAEEVAAGALRERLAATVPDYMIPAAFVTLAAMPRTPNGKLDRKALPRPELEASGDRTDPRTPAEEVLAGIWAGVLGIDRVGVEDDFFALGGHSLLGTRILARVRAATGVELPLRTLFETPTIAHMAERIAAAQQGASAAAPPLVPGPREGAQPLSYAQQRLWLVDQLEPERATYNIPLVLRLDGPLDASALERSLAEIVRRHDALRTTFTTAAGEPRQVIAAAEAAFRLPLVELAALPEAEREAEARRLASEDAARPFDLARGPLFRGTLVRLEPRAHVLLLCMHHIVSDGWSIAVLTRELAALYAAFASGGHSPLPELPIQYADHARWQRAWLSGEVLAGQLAYWKQQLQGAPAALTLPLDHPRPAVESHRGAVLPVQIPRELAAALTALSHREGVTLFMTLLAAFQVLLHRHSGQADVVVGSPVAGRTRVETEPLIGFLVNTLVLRGRLGDDPSFRALLAQAREATLGAHAHQDVPFEKLVEELAPPRDLGRSPLFQAMFIFQNARSAPPPLGDVAVRRLAVERSIAKFDLTLMLEETDQGLTGSLEYATDLFEAATIARMAGHLQVLLEAAVT